MQLTPEDKLILSCIKIHPTTTELEQLNSFIPFIPDWEVLTNNLIDRGIGPLLFNKLPQLPNSPLIPSVQRTKLQQTYYKTFSRSTILYEYFRKVIEAFTAGNINVIALKGIYLSEWLYQDIGLRQFSDIDLLVKEEDGDKCVKLLMEMGYKPRISNQVSEFISAKSDFVHYSPMELNNVSVEIHIKLHMNGLKFHLLMDEVWQNAEPVIVNKVAVKTLDTNDLLIHLCIHLHKHFQGGHVQFTCFNDITNLLEKYAENFNWSEFELQCRKYNCVEEVFKYLVLVNKYFNAAVPKYIIEKHETLLDEKEEELFYKYLHGYSFEQANKSAIPVHINNLKQLRKFTDLTKYFIDLMFPPKKFMLDKYKINHQGLYMFYYPYRWWVGAKGLLKLIIKN